MASVLSELAREEGTYVIRVAFTDENGTAVTPSAATWTLTNEAGTVINSRSAVTITSLASSVDIVLSANDLAISNQDDVDRVLTVQATYTSDLGVGLPLKDEVQFRIAPLLVVT